MLGGRGMLGVVYDVVECVVCWIFWILVVGLLEVFLLRECVCGLV